MRTLLATGLLVVLAAGAADAEGVLQVNGFATASYSGDFDRRAAQFSLDQAELDVSHELSPRGSARVDLEWVWDGQAWAVAVEQGRLDYKPSFAPSLTLTGGRFNAPIGFELLDPPDMYQITHGLLFTYCTPANLTGAMAGLGLGRGFDVKAYAANDWELNGENNGSPTFGGRLGWTSGTTFSGGVSLVSGMRDPAQEIRNSVLDLDVAWNPAAKLLVGGEWNGCQADVAGSGASWMGFMLMANWKLHPACSVTARYDWVNDPDDLLFGSGLQEQRSSATVAPSVVLGPGMRLQGELRLDRSDADVFINHEDVPKSSSLGGAINMTYNF
jgi:hypothetical protein